MTWRALLGALLASGAGYLLGYDSGRADAKAEVRDMQRTARVGLELVKEVIFARDSEAGALELTAERRDDELRHVSNAAQTGRQ